VAAFGLAPDRLTSILDDYKKLGVENILCVRGDKPADLVGFKSHPQSFSHASDFLLFARKNYHFCLGIAGYPEGHVEAPSLDKDIEYLKLKVQNGARFIITQYFYNNRFFFNFVEKCRNVGIEVPIFVGIMPIYTVKLMESLARLCHATITQEIRDGLARIPPDDKDSIRNFGVDLAINQCRELIRFGIDGIHFYTMNRYKSVRRIVNRLRSEGLIKK
jgi:methylenetetrahydrofolate reductase (NADPH)